LVHPHAGRQTPATENTLNIQLPQPISNGDSKPYWQAAAEDRLVIRKCNSCGNVHFMPRYLCPSCWSEDLEWIEACGKGTVYSFTVIRRASDPAFSSLVPYVVALIDLEEGPRMMANVIGPNAIEVSIGDTVEVLFEDRGAETKVPQFTRVAR
jgi:hypothetical protein